MNFNFIGDDTTLLKLEVYVKVIDR